MLLSKRSGLDIEQDALFYNLQRERTMVTLRALSAMVDAGEFKDWHYPSICLFSMIDWLDFRALVDFEGVENLLAFRDDNVQQPMAAETDPRKA
jgi:glutathione S-transferase